MLLLLLFSSSDKVKYIKADLSFLVLYILADWISSLEIQRLQQAGSSSTVFAVKLILYCKSETRLTYLGLKVFCFTEKLDTFFFDRDENHSKI